MSPVNFNKMHVDEAAALYLSSSGPVALATSACMMQLQMRDNFMSGASACMCSGHSVFEQYEAGWSQYALAFQASDACRWTFWPGAANPRAYMLSLRTSVQYCLALWWPRTTNEGSSSSSIATSATTPHSSRCRFLTRLCCAQYHQLILLALRLRLDGMV